MKQLFGSHASIALSLIGIGLSAAGAASAQTSSPQGSPPAAAAPATPPAIPGRADAGPPAAAPEAAPPAPASSPTCAAGNTLGVPPADADTAVWLVCSELRNRAPVTTGAPAHYRVDLLTLGRSKILSVTLESPPGQPRDSRTLRLGSIDEVGVAAPRVAQALIEGSSVESTQKVSNLVASETRRYHKKGGSFGLGGGVIGTTLAGAGGIYPGMSLRAEYETARYGIGGDLRFAGGDDEHEGEGGSHVALSVGGRYFLSEGDVAPFVGTGVSWSGIGVESEDLEPGRRFDGGGSGLGVYGEVGLELLRLHKGRLAIDIRAEAPLYDVDQDTYPVYDADTDTYEEPEPTHHYVVPVTFGLVYTFGGN